MIKVLIADDHAIVREGVKRILEESGEGITVDEAADGESALQRVSDAGYQAVILDIGLPGMDGLEVLRQLQELEPDLPVLLFSVYPEAQYATRGLKSGASGYLTKDRAPEELLAAIRTITAGRRFITASLAEQLAGNLDRDGVDVLHERLSEREFQVLRMIASGQTVSQIARDLGLSVKTVSTYRARIMDKTGFKNNAELTRYALRSGLVE